jgi:predicted ArsR family transcriptional regulator
MKKTRSEILRRALVDAPSTEAELATVLGLSSRQVIVGLWVLKNQGHVRRAGAVANPAYGECGQRKTLVLYELTGSGRHKQREEAPLAASEERS